MTSRTRKSNQAQGVKVLWGAQKLSYENKQKGGGLCLVGHAYKLGTRLSELEDVRKATGSVTLNFGRTK
jgi:hypothetical protein